MKKLIFVFALVGLFGVGSNFALAAGPSVLTTVPSATASSVTLNGSFLSNGSPTTTMFEYSTNSNDLPNGQMGSGIIPSSCQVLQSASSGSFSCTLNTPTITAGTVYFFRTIGTNINGTTYGNKTSIQTTSNSSSYAPTLSSLSPNSGTQGQTLNVDLYGTNFVNGASVNFGSNITVNSTSFVSGTQLTSSITISSGATTGGYNVTVTSGGQTTGAQTFTVNSTGGNGGLCSFNPSISSLSPASAVVGSGTMNVIIYGNNFDNSSIPRFNGSNRTIVGNIYSNQITMTVLASDLSTPASVNVSIANANGSCTSNGSTFIINSNGSNIGGGGGGGYYYSTPLVTTQSAGNVASNSAIVNALVNPNGSTSTAWYEYGTGSTLASFNETLHVSQGAANSYSSLVQSLVNLTPNTTYYFRAVANNSYGTVKGNISSFNTGNLSSVVTTIQATNQTDTTARLNGNFVNQNGNNAQAYFEYGTIVALGSTTNVQSLNTSSSVNFSDTITGLTPGTIYYFRAVTVNQGSTYRGSILVFQTKGAGDATNTTDTSAPTPVTTSQSSILKITTTADNIAVGGDIEYLVTFNNKNSVNFENTKISVQLPKEVDFQESNFGKVNSDNVVELNAGILVPNQVGSMTIKGKVNSNAGDKSVLVTTAVMTYNVAGSTDKKDETAYVTNHVATGTGLEANSLFGANFLPSTLVGWLALLLVMLGLGVVGRKLYSDYVVKTPMRSPVKGSADHFDNLPM